MLKLSWLCPLRNRLALVRRLPPPNSLDRHDGVAPERGRVLLLKSRKRA